MIDIGMILGGKYRVDRIIAEGGMGIVAEGTHLELETKVAIKILRPELRRSNDAMARFVREARAVVKLESDHVVRMIDVNPSDPIAPYMVMELLEGEDLDHMIHGRGALPIPLAAKFVREACAGLAAAHAAGIVHRDLKPGNLFYAKRPDGTARIKVVDFGISKVRDSRPNSVKLTGPTDLFGSPAYMSPEQIDGAVNADARTDVWALGAILYELVTGQSAFAGDTVPQTLVNVSTGRMKPMREHTPDVPPELDAIVKRCLSRKPDARFATVLDLAAALVPFEPGAAPIVLPPVREKLQSIADAPSTLAAVETDPSGDIPLVARRRTRAIRVVAATVVVAGLISIAAFLRANSSKDSAQGHALATGAPSIASVAEKTPPPPPPIATAPQASTQEQSTSVSIDALPSAHAKTPSFSAQNQHAWNPPPPAQPPATVPQQPPPPPPPPAQPTQPKTPFSDFGPRK